jgi:hypothetical protein
MVNLYSVAVEIDRCFKLNLSNGQFLILVSYINSFEDKEKIIRKLFQSNPKSILLTITEIQKDAEELAKK